MRRIYKKKRTNKNNKHVYYFFFFFTGEVGFIKNSKKKKYILTRCYNNLLIKNSCYLFII